MKNRNIKFISILIFLIIIGIGVYIRNKNQNIVSFEKKQKCQALQSELENRLEQDYTKPLYEETELDELFYSYGRDSCIYTYRVWGTGKIGKPSFYLVDVLTNQKLFEIWLSDDIVKNRNLMDRFDEVVEKYKDPQNSLTDLPISKHLVK